MPYWYELNQQFHALSQSLRHHNLQYQYGGTIYQPADASALVALELSHYDSPQATPTGGGSIHISQRDGVISIGQQGDLHAPKGTITAKNKKKRKMSLWQWAISATTILAGIVGLLQWLQIGPHPQPSPAGRESHYNDDLHVMKFAHGPIEAGRAININLYLRYTGSDPAHVHSSYGVDLLPLSPAEQADSSRVTGLTESMWSSYLAQGLHGEDMTIPPNTQQFVSTWSRPLTQQQSDDWHLRSTGLFIALGRISWADDAGTYDTDFCVLALASNPDVIVLCKNHNGPVKRTATK